MIRNTSFSLPSLRFQGEFQPAAKTTIKGYFFQGTLPAAKPDEVSLRKFDASRYDWVSNPADLIKTIRGRNPGDRATTVRLAEDFTVKGQEALLTDADLRGVVFRRCSRETGEFLTDKPIVLRNVDLTGTDFLDADCTGLVLEGVRSNHTYFSEANLTGLVAREVPGTADTPPLRNYFEGAEFADAKLAGADLSGADFGGLDLRGVDLRTTVLPLNKVNTMMLSKAIVTPEQKALLDKRCGEEPYITTMGAPNVLELGA